ncbi:uncharacterized protein LOC123309089 [Coccinella septempunctata]|uniref:uncharacterized protein LOC123309089 n=1 Tax=Coccinella septempunctata TaxID=41139 RepID=UPI001D0918AB|nr:uncharacterized protein LOC123309089 [Coccinella septempunctata]
MLPKIIIVLNSIFLLKLASASITQQYFDYDVLNKNLFESLKLHPKLNVEGYITEKENKFIDKYVNDYFELTANSLENKRKKRPKRGLSISTSYPSDEFGTYIFSGIKYLDDIPSHNASKFEYFQQSNKWFFVTIEQAVIGNVKLPFTNLLIFRIQNNTYSRVPQWKIHKAEEFSIHSARNATYIILKASDQYYSGVWEFDGLELVQVQNMEMEKVTDVGIWETETEMHMAISGIGFRNQTMNLNETKNYNTTFLYKWNKYYFNLIQVIDELSSRVLTFSVEGNYYLLLSIKNEKNGEYSEIYRYNLANGLYEIHQRLPTYNCRDVKFFYTKNVDGYDSYLLMANYVSGEDLDEIPPIVYKYVDGYFLPFQNLYIENIVDFQTLYYPKNEVLLLLARTEFQGLKTYQYDGWIFQETPHDINSDLNEPKITNAKFGIIENNKTVLVLGIAKQNGQNILDIYEIDFVYENEIFDFRNETIKWCEASAKKLTQVLRQKRQIKSGENQTRDITNDELVEKIQRATSLLEDLEQQTANSLQYDGPHIVQNLEADEIIMTDPQVRFLSSQTINDANINELLDNLIYVNEDEGWPNGIVLERAQIDSQIHPDFINGKNIEDVISLDDNLSIKNLIVVGETTFSQPVITETLNNIPFDEEHILMRDSDQIIPNLDVEDVRVDNLNVVGLNGGREENEDIEPISKISKLKAERMTVGGLMNDVSIGTLDKYALRTSGDQVLTGKYFFEELLAQNIEGQILNSKRLEDLVRVDSGNYKLDTNVEFTKTLTVNELFVKALLDSIPVAKDKLLVLLKDTVDTQYVRGEKLMNNVELLSPIKLQGNIKGNDVNKFNPIVHIDGPFIYEGDFAIGGNTTIEKLLVAKDIRSVDGNRSVKRVLSHGIPLQEKEIDINLNFNQQLIVDEVYIDKINGVDPNTWVVTGTQEPQIIKGTKVFVNDVNVTGNTDFFKINDILVSDLDNRILRKTGDQVITGKHTIVNVVANRISGNTTTIGNNTWKNILTTDSDQVIFGTTFINADVEADSTIAELANINGTINGYNFTEVARDTVTINSEKRITGHKTFKNLTATDLNVANMDLTQKRKFTVNEDTRLEKASVENLHFMKKCNQKEANELDVKLNEDNQQTISELSDFEELVVLGNVFIESNYLGEMDLERFDRETIKIDEEHVFGTVVFNNTLISDSPIELHGDIEKVDLDNLVSTSEDLLSIMDRKIFLNNLKVYGTAFLAGTVNNFDMIGMCTFSDVSNGEKELDLIGNAVFVKGPQVYNIMNETVKTIHENAWLKNKEVNIDQEMSFKKITFRKSVTVKGTVDDVNLEVLEKEYFSKSKDQAITGGLYFSNNVIFAKNLVCPEVAMNGEVNGVKIQELPRTVLLQDMDQLFEDIAYFESIIVDDLQGEFTVNNLSLETDLMRYDSKNVVTGIKRLNTLEVGNLELKQNTTVQDVDVLDWIQNAILKKGTFIVEKRKILQGNVHFDRPLGLQGSLNGEMFTNETIMLKSVAQKVTGVKTFELRPREMMRFRNVKLRGLLNDMQISDLLDDQSGSGDMVLKSPVHFYNDIFTKNIELKKPFKGVEMDIFLSDLNDLEKSDLVEKYAKLLNMTVRLNRNLRVESFYLLSYKDLQEIENPQYIVNSCCDNPTLIYFDYVNDSYVMRYYYWDQDLNIFQKSVNLAVNLGYPPIKTMTFSLDRQQFLYLEYPAEEHRLGGLFRGQFWKVESLNRLIDYGSIDSNGICQITPIRIDESYCILVIYDNVKPPHIFCEFNLGHMRLTQSLPSGKYTHSEYMSIDGISFLILLNNHEENTSQAGVEIWCLHKAQFGIRQVLYFSDPPPKSISTITYKGYHYLSIVYRGGIHQGHIDILRYSKSSGNFEQWQKITSINQVKAEFSILPSGELFFFVLGPSNETLSIYKYVGVSGFKEEITIPSSKDIHDFKHFTLGRKHFVMISTQDKLKILQAQFKGNTEESL